MKSKRDITLGEMHDECVRRKGFCLHGGECAFRAICREQRDDDFQWRAPIHWDGLTVTPRFTEEQMAFLRGAYAVGATRAHRYEDGHTTFNTSHGYALFAIKAKDMLGDLLEIEETLWLEEMFGEVNKD